MSQLILVLGDQLSRSISSLKNATEDDLIVMMEVASETDYVWHHRRKMVFLFSAMRHFCQELQNKGLNTHYIKLDDEDNKQNFVANIIPILETGKYSEVIVTEPGEYRLLKYLEEELESLDTNFQILKDNRFFISIQEFKEYASDAKQLKLENFYRLMRNKTAYLMDGDKPLGGKWNYDHENRSSYDGKTKIPKRPEFTPDETTEEVIELIEKSFPKRFGSVENFDEAVTREHALKKLDFFIEHCLSHFGKFQDAMVEGESFLFHSRLSHLINCGLLDAKEVCEKVLEVKDDYPLASIEGFIRQIIGWREYIRGIYWLKMPEYADSNYFNHENPLPDFYWSGKSKMNCVNQVVKSTEKTAYSHHIQRLMVTGNLALLMQINPVEVHNWYLAVYDDAYEWVELPNTYGMALHADGGLMATKPYISSGNYINKMSDYCQNCQYKVKDKLGENACPFNYLYWNFLHKHKEKLSDNHRLSMPYRNLDKKDDDEIEEIQKYSQKFIKSHCK